MGSILSNYVKVSTSLAQQKEFAEIENDVNAELAFSMYLQATCYCARTLSDGFIPRREVSRLTRMSPKKAEVVVRCLQDVGLFVARERGFFLPKYLEEQSSRV